jgi:hypothetical protein
VQQRADATSVAPPARWLRFRVVDSGIGVESGAGRAAESMFHFCLVTWPLTRSFVLSAKLERIFLPFIQANASTIREYGGTGLGLTARSHPSHDAVTRCMQLRPRVPMFDASCVSSLRRSVGALRAPCAAT